MKGTWTFSALPLQSLFKINQEKQTNKPGAHGIDSQRFRWLRWPCYTDRDDLCGLGCWSHWVLTTRHPGQFRNLSEMPEAHRWCACHKEKKMTITQNYLTCPSEVKNRQFYARKKKRLRRLARSCQCSVKTRDKPGLVFHFANINARSQPGVKELCSLNRPLCLTSLLYTEESWTWAAFKAFKASWEKAVHMNRLPRPTIHTWWHLKQSRWETRRATLHT